MLLILFSKSHSLLFCSVTPVGRARYVRVECHLVPKQKKGFLPTTPILSPRQPLHLSDG